MATIVNSTTVSRNQSLLWVILRIVLGLILIIKGIFFIKDTTELNTMIQETGIGFFSQNAEILAFVISVISILTGTFIVIGLFTRLSSIIQIPIIIVAVFFVNIRNIDYGVGELILSLFVLILLITFAVKGSGLISADQYFKSVFRKDDRDNTSKNELEE